METHTFSSCLVLSLDGGVLLGWKEEKRDSVKMARIFPPVITQMNLTKV